MTVESKCHLKTRDGWTKTIRQNFPGTSIVVPFQLPWPESVPGTGGSYYRKEFRIVKHRSTYLAGRSSANSEVEYWLEEI